MPPNASMSPSIAGTSLSFAQRMTAAKFLTENFKFERYAYLILTVTSVIMVFALSIHSHASDLSGALPLFGPTGLVTCCVARIFWMFTKIQKVILG